jgi:TMEM175 potassium channel family protein
MARRHPTPERLGAFSDGVLAIIITIMVLELRPPHEVGAQALGHLWPTFLSYALSYIFVGVFWANHHHMLQHAEQADHMVVWANLFVLFFVSLIPFFTDYMAENRLAPFAMAIYAADCFMITATYMLLQKVIATQFASNEELRHMDRGAHRRNCIALVSYAVAIPSGYLHPLVPILIILGIGGVYFIPDAFSRITGGATR